MKDFHKDFNFFHSNYTFDFPSGEGGRDGGSRVFPLLILQESQTCIHVLVKTE
jgi:hypothetical protein